MALDTTRTIGIGTIVKFDTAGGSTWTTAGLVTKAKPAATAVEMVDTTVLADTREHMQGGIQKATRTTITMLSANAATTYATLVTAAKAKSNISWQFTTPHATPQTFTDKGIIEEIAMEEISNKEGLAFSLTICTTEPVTVA
jgi:hypothetical protein